MHEQHRITGHVRLVHRARGPVFYAKYRTVEMREGVPKGIHKTKLLGPAWTKRGRPEEGFLTEATANRALMALLADEEGKAGKPQAVAGITFAQAVDNWLEYCEEDGCRPSTLRDYRTTGRRLKEAFGDRFVTEVSSQDLEALKRELKRSGLSARSVNRVLTIAGSVFRRAEAQWGITHNPATGIKVKRLREPAYSAGRINYLKQEEVFALVEATPNEQDKALFLTAAFSGLRQGELLALTWNDIDFPHELIHVRGSYDQYSKETKTTKSGKARSVPMAEDVAMALARLRNRERFTADADLVFPDWKGTPQYHGDLRSRFYSALERAQLPRVRFHDLRHTFGTMMAGEGIDVVTLQHWMGHAHQATTSIYLHYRPGKSGAEAINRAIRAGGAPAMGTLEAAQ
jgi:integrase